MDVTLSAGALIENYKTINALKQLKRRGWEIEKIDGAESVADHTLGVSLLVLIMANRRGLDVARCLSMALLHDIAEVLVGDIVPTDGVPLNEKRERERNAAVVLLSRMDPGGELLAVWEEYTRGESEESRLVHDMDKLELALQAREYESAHERDLESFFQYAENRMHLSEIRDVLAEIRRRRHSVPVFRPASLATAPTHPDRPDWRWQDS